MTRWCPQCRAGWPDERSTCIACLAQLVDDPDATVTCKYCDVVWPGRMQSCPQCLAELHPDPQAAALGLTDLLVAGRRLPRPPDVAAFAAAGPDCTLLRTSPDSPLIYVGPLDWMEAFVRSAGNSAATPLTCCDVDGTILFRLAAGTGPPGTLAASDPDGAVLATYVPHEGEVEVRDAAGTATVARLEAALGGWQVMAAGAHLADLLVTEIALGTTHVDDQWELRVHHDLAVPDLAAIALPLAAKILLGWTSPRPAASMTSETVT